MSIQKHQNIGRKQFLTSISSLSKLLMPLFFLYLGFANMQAADEGCANGSILFREDFGGNNPEDPEAKGSGIPECEGYTYDDNPVDYSKKGKYAIRKIAVSGHAEWYNSIIDHTYPDDKNKGYFMQVDASHLACQFYETQIDDVCEGSTLYVSLYGTSCTRRTTDLNAQIRLVVEDAGTGVEIDHYDIEMPNAQKGEWVQYGFSFTVPTNCTSIIYRIINNADPNIISGGNDFCLDDIEIRACLPLPTITPTKGTSLCIGESEMLTGDMDNTTSLPLPLTFTWYKSRTPSYDPSDWSVVGFGKSFDLFNVTKDDAGYYKVLVTGAGQTASLNSCSSISEFYYIDVVDCGSSAPKPCPDATLLFKEDFGGNKVSDPDVKEEAIPQCSYAFGDDPRDSQGNGKYSIRKAGVKHNQWYYPLYDHTHPDDADKGYFMQVDASNVSGIFYQTEITGLCENSELYMSTWAMSATKTRGWANVFLKLIVEDLNGNELASSKIEIENCKGVWEQFGLSYVVPAGQSSVIYKIVNNSSTSQGNDFCLDDIEVRLCNPPIKVNSPDSLCPGSDVTLTAEFENDGTYQEPVNFTWYRCDTASYEPSDWTKVGSGDKLEITNVSEADEGYYRVWVSSNNASQLISKCNAASDFAEIRIKNCDVCEDTIISIEDTILQGIAYQKNGFDIAEPLLGMNYDTLHLEKADGCDSTVALNLYVFYNSHDTILGTICQGETYELNGFSETETGTYTHSFKNTYGGDSLITLQLQAFPTYNDTIYATVNKGETYSFMGEEYGNEDTIFTTSLLSQNGCDSLVTLNLKVLNGIEDTILASICPGDSFTSYGFHETKAGTYTQNLKCENGADSIVILILDILPTYDDTITATIIEGDTYDFNGKKYDKEGLYSEKLQTQSGCDSLVTLNLTVLQGTSDTIRASICQGEHYTSFGFDESAEGTYTQKLTNTNGTDSLVTLVLNVHPTYTDTVNAYIPEGDKYSFNGNEYDKDGLYTTILKTSAGCDSSVTLNLTILKGTSDTIRASICQGESYTSFGFDESAEGSYTQKLTQADGTDSLVTLVLEVLPTYADTISATIPEGTYYSFNGKEYDTEGLYTAELKSDASCDSLVTLKLTVLKGSSDTIRASICPGESYTSFGFDESEEGTYTQELIGANGTDSLITLVLAVLPTYDDTITATIIEGDTYTFNGKEYDTEGTYTAKLKSDAGCDSIVTLKLAILNGTSDTIRASICQGESYSSFGFDESEGGTFTQNLTSANGTDSLVTLVLEILPTYDDTVQATIIEGDTYTFDGKEYDTEGFHTAHLKTAAGCDSVVTLHLTILKGTSDTIHATICQGERFTSFGFDVAEAGLHTQKLKNTAGADSLVTLQLTILPTFHETIRDSFCAGDPYTKHGFNVTEGGTYQQNLKSHDACDSIITLILTELPSYEKSIFDTICEGSAYAGNGFDLPDEISGTSTHTLSFQTISGCDSSITLHLNVLPLRTDSQTFLIKPGEIARYNGKRYKEEGNYHQFFQTSDYCEEITVVVKFQEDTTSIDTFSFVEIIPDEILFRGDGTDKRWHVENIELYPLATVAIYDRWGKKLFEIVDYNDETGWDGTYNGYDMPSTDYWYQIEVREIDRFYTGHFTLIR